MDELQHWGVKGMKWGVRKKRGLGIRSTKDTGPEWMKRDRASRGINPNTKSKNHGMVVKKDLRNSKRISKNSQLSELEQYKRSQRTKQAVGGVLGTIGVLAVGATAIAIPLKIGYEFLNAITGGALKD